jgi:acetate kinase
MKVLVLNSGSSSQKSVLFDLDSDQSELHSQPLWQGKIEWDADGAALEVHTTSGAALKEETQTSDRRAAVARLLETLCRGQTAVLKSPTDLDVVGHRVVHGGPRLFEPVLITADVKKEIARIEPFAPLHNRAELQGIELIEKWAGRIPQVAVFDTGFHRTMPRAASLYPGPYEWFEQGIVRYGFHGINHEYCSRRVAQIMGKRSSKVITCHLGNGCSLAAIQDGKSMDTTMGFTPLDGLMMGTRSGSLDPGILTYLMRETSVTGDTLDETLNQRSGLLGISGVSSDMRQVLAAAAQGNERAQLAFDMFVHRLHRGIGAMAASLGGPDVLVFTGGIGENSAEVRSAACTNLRFLGIELDASQNTACKPDQEISAKNSAVKVLVLRAQEDWAIAQACFRILSTTAASSKTV